MQTFLHHDEASGELRLVMTDLWDGKHERTEFRVIGTTDGYPLRNRPEWDGRPAYSDSFGGHYVKALAGGAHIPFTTEQTAIGPTVKTPCPKATNRRRKCALCA